MRVNKKLERWRLEGLISETQAEKIIQFEKNNKSGLLFHGLLWTGSFSIFLGIISIIASNWELIPGGVKITTGLFLNLLAGISVYYFHKKNDILRELSILLYSGLILGCIALIGQVYQLDGTVASALFTWSLLSLPVFIYYSKSKLGLLPGLGIFLTGVMSGFIEYITPYTSDEWEMVFATAFISLFSPLAFYGIKISKNQSFKEILYFASFLLVIIVTSLLIQLWLDHLQIEAWLLFVIPGIAVLGYGLLVLLKRQFGLPNGLEMELMGVSYGLGAMNIICSSLDAPFVGAILFCSYWLYLAYVFSRMGKHLLVYMSMIVVTLRLVFVYLEVFGSMLSTGIGLVTSGILIFVLLWGGYHAKKRYEEKTKEIG